ncbi:MAG: ribbon-helix-helix protein, CopG family [Nitrospirae bacterium]|nr:ribbon-helix-helix protein, CopG family [Nitrospirota bacterium]
MQSQLTVRLSDDLDKEISILAKRLHLKRSDIVRMALERFLDEFQGKEEVRPYEKVKNLIGAISSGISNHGESHREHLLRKFKKYA